LAFLAWRLVDLCAYIEQTYRVRYSRWGLSCLLKWLNLLRLKTRHSHPKGGPAVQAAFKKGTPVKAAHHRGGAS
jgi:transposase